MVLGLVTVFICKHCVLLCKCVQTSEVMHSVLAVISRFVSRYASSGYIETNILNVWLFSFPFQIGKKLWLYRLLGLWLCLCTATRLPWGNCSADFDEMLYRGPDVDGRIILGWIFGKWEGLETGWSWLRIGRDGEHLWIRWWTFGFYKVRGVSWLAAEPVSFSRRTLLHGVSKLYRGLLKGCVRSCCSMRVSFMSYLTYGVNYQTVFAHYWARSQNCDRQLLASRHVCPSVRMEQLGSHWTDFHEILYLRIFEICRENSIFIQIWPE